MARKTKIHIGSRFNSNQILFSGKFWSTIFSNSVINNTLQHRRHFVIVELPVPGGEQIRQIRSMELLAIQRHVKWDIFMGRKRGSLGNQCLPSSKNKSGNVLTIQSVVKMRWNEMMHKKWMTFFSKQFSIISPKVSFPSPKAIPYLF